MTKRMGGLKQCICWVEAMHQPTSQAGHCDKYRPTYWPECSHTLLLMHNANFGKMSTICSLKCLFWYVHLLLPFLLNTRSFPLAWPAASSILVVTLGQKSGSWSSVPLMSDYALQLLRQVYRCTQKENVMNMLGKISLTIVEKPWQLEPRKVFQLLKGQRT